MGRTSAFILYAVDTVMQDAEARGISIDAATERYFLPLVAAAERDGDAELAAQRRQAMALVAKFANALDGFVRGLS